MLHWREPRRRQLLAQLLDADAPELAAIHAPSQHTRERCEGEDGVGEEPPLFGQLPDDTPGLVRSQALASLLQTHSSPASPSKSVNEYHSQPLNFDGGMRRRLCDTILLDSPTPPTPPTLPPPPPATTAEPVPSSLGPFARSDGKDDAPEDEAAGSLMKGTCAYIEVLFIRCLYRGKGKPTGGDEPEEEEYAQIREVLEASLAPDDLHLGARLPMTPDLAYPGWHGGDHGVPRPQWFTDG